ncbi:hypothetical protein EH223_20405 [candidate division KSB1 bacterium]|nr:hypothetical protein [candidate division KSB1 bacterium]RQV99865.1 MAG: hypothetical protein EH223_20405 [candidate division KSB1 bacterium]
MKQRYDHQLKTTLIRDRIAAKICHLILLCVLFAVSALAAEQIKSTAQSRPGPIVWPPVVEIMAKPVSGFVLSGLTADTLRCEQVMWRHPQSGELLGTVATDPGTKQFTFELPNGHTVELTCQLPGYTARQYALTAGTTPLQQNILVFPTEVTVEKEMIAEDMVSVFNDPVKLSDTDWEITIDIKKYLSDSLAFFVTGYYRYNVSSSLPVLQGLIDEHPQQLGYLRITEQDLRSSLVIDNLISAIYSNSHQLFGQLEQDSTLKILHIDIVGYADDRTINAVYVEESIRHNNPDDFFPVNEIAIQQGETINNTKLSQLRAWYTMNDLQALFSQSDPYKELVKMNKIDYRLYGAGVSELENKSGLTEAELNKKYAEARRATITLRGEHVTQ